MKKQIIFILLFIALTGAAFYLFIEKNTVVTNNEKPGVAFDVMTPSTSLNFVSSTQKTNSTPALEPKKGVQKQQPVILKSKPEPEQTPVVSEPKAEPIVPSPVNTNISVSANDVLFFTNKAREANGGLVSLKSNSILNAIAAKRVDDMFTYQYFSHSSPSNMDMINLAKNEGYNYSAIGENIIMGDFDSSMEVVNTWMGSAGHRANILSTQYDEIGVAIKKGLYNGREQWIGVQIFGRQLN